MVESAMVPESEVEVSVTYPTGVDTMVKATMKHIPTGIVVEGSAPSAYRVKRDLLEKLSYAVEEYNDG